MTNLRTPSGRIQVLINELDKKIKEIDQQVSKLRFEQDGLQDKLELLCKQKRCPHQNHQQALYNGETYVYVCPDCGLVWDKA